MQQIPSSLVCELRKSAEKLKVYKDPDTSEHWLYDKNEEDFTHCKYAVVLAKLLQCVVEYMPPERGYVLPPPLPLQIGTHSRFNPYGAPWQIDHELGAVIHCHNRISVGELGRGYNQSIVERLYHAFNKVPPTNLWHALALSQQVHKATWFTMNAHKSKRQGLLSRCNCCSPPRVMVISWEHRSSPDLLHHCRQELQAWIGLSYDTLSGDFLRPCSLPSV